MGIEKRLMVKGKSVAWYFNRSDNVELIKKYDHNEMNQSDDLMHIMGDNVELEEVISSVTDWLADLIANNRLKTT